MLYEEFGELGPEFRLPGDIKNLSRPWTWENYHRPLPEVLPLHGLMVQRDMGTMDTVTERWPIYEDTFHNLKITAKIDTGREAGGPILGIGYFQELRYPPPEWRPEEPPHYSWEFCLSGFALPELGLYQSVRGPNDTGCIHLGTLGKSRESQNVFLQDFKPLDESSPWVRAMLKHLRAWDWSNTTIVHEDRMVDTSLDPPEASTFGEWWEDEWNQESLPYIYHITYPAQIAEIRDSGVLLPYRGYARLTWCPDNMVANTFGASRFIRIPVEDIPEGLIDVTYDDNFVLQYPEVAETISEYLYSIDRDRLDDPSYVLKVAAEISRYQSECEVVFPGPLVLPPSTEWGIPALGPMGLLFG